MFILLSSSIELQTVPASWCSDGLIILELRTLASIHSSNNALVSRIRRAHAWSTCTYMHVATIETISEANERIQAKVLCIAPSAARDGDMLSVWERLFSCALRG